MPVKGRRLLINFKPFWIKVFAGEELLIAVNSAGLFKFEHFREKQAEEKNEDAFWEVSLFKSVRGSSSNTHGQETFYSQTDTKPFGSSSIGIDVEFFGFKYLYGLPEHASTHALTSTK